MRLTDHHVVGIKRQLKPNTSPPRLIIKAEVKQLAVIHMTFSKTWTIEKDIPDRSTDREDVPRHATMTIYSNVKNLVMCGLKAADGPHQSYVAIRPDIEEPHTRLASQTKSWNTNSQKGSNP